MDNFLTEFLEIKRSHNTIVDVLRYRALHQPDKLAFIFLQDGEAEKVSLTYQQLDLQAQAIAAQLQSKSMKGERALLLYPPSLEFIAAFFGCLYAGVIAIPVYPPRPNQSLSRLQAIVADAQATIALTCTNVLSRDLTQSPELQSLHWIATDDCHSNITQVWHELCINDDDLAFLQYTSGSTGKPKGVMVNHCNLLHNSEYIKQAFALTPGSVSVTWLPSYHDMGLIDGIIQPLYTGFLGVLMPPLSFLQQPIRWLRAISHYKATHCGGPNFAYELCVRKITLEQLETLDLSSWCSAYNGAEPIRRETLERFAATFKPCGFQANFFYPCYGMAETTLMVSGGDVKDKPVYYTVQMDALEQNRVLEADENNQNARHIVGCGRAWLDTKIIIADPESLTQCAPNQVGEIWVSGLSVAQGYWNQPEKTEQTFNAYLADSGEGPFLRTGDLGFLRHNELFVTGRLKDIIIIRGRNHYPQDIEVTVERSHQALRLGCSAAFAVDVNGEERLVVVQEVERSYLRKLDVDEVVGAIRKAVFLQHELEVYAVLLLKTGSIPKTSSGKIQRHACRSGFLTDNLKVVASNILESTDFVEMSHSLKRETLLALAPRECQLILESYIQELVAQVLKITASQVNPRQSINALGLDSLKIFELKNQIEADLKIAVSIGDFFESFSITQLATKILAHLTTTDVIPLIPLAKFQKDTDVYPLSFAQLRLWFIDQLEKGNPAYNIAFAVHLKGMLQVKLLEQSLNEIVQRHEVLRTTFSTAESRPIQVISPSLTLSLPTVDCQKLPDFEREYEMRRLATQESQQPFDLTQGPLLRAKLVRLDQQEHMLFLTMHHIIFDRWSAEVLIQEMAALYQTFLTESPSPFPDLPIQYKDFACWQQQWLQGEILQTQLTYWKQQLDGAPAVLQLPTDHQRPAVQTYRGTRQSLELPKTVAEALKTLSQKEGVTLFMLLLAAFKTFLYRYTGQDDISVGSPIANRNRSELKWLMGFFVNTLVLRTNLSGNPSFRELLHRVRQVALEAYAHQDLPFEQLVEALQPERDVSYTPLFQVLFTIENALQLPEIPGLNLNLLEVESPTAQFDLSLSMKITDQGLVASLEYNTDLFDAATITRMLKNFQTLLEGIVANPQQRISELPLLNQTEQHQLLVEWNDTQTEYAQDKCIHHLFEAQVEKTPDDLALVFENQHLTYRELNNKANQLAQYLRTLGVKPEVLVAICMERSLEMIVGILGILKAGGAYVPLDPVYPQERLAFMLSDSQAPVLLTQQKLLSRLTEHKMRVVCLDTDWKVISQERKENLIDNTLASNLAYVIYTSGSTGQPKGVLVAHQGLCNLVAAQIKTLDLQPNSRFLQIISLSFDAATSHIFLTLCSGATLCLANKDFVISISELFELLHSQAITHVAIPVSLLEVLPVEEFPTLRIIITGGEACFTETVTKWAQGRRFFYEYGLTETTVCSTVAELTNYRGQPHIGRPIANTQIYLLDHHLQLVPIGVPGELCISGLGLARGYLNHPGLTKEKFIPNPFSDEAGAHLYKTGDLARYLSDGKIQFLGRIDHQVKIRGFRIELGEIEAVLIQHPNVQQAVVTAWEDQPGKQRLVAYVVSKQEHNTNSEDLTQNLRNHLSKHLPNYMVPEALMILNALPVTPNGKIDHRALPTPEGYSQLADAYIMPQTNTERLIAAVWQDELQLERVGINDNFFSLGGHSLLLIKIQAKLNEIFPQRLSVVDMFKYPTIKSLAKHLSQNLNQQADFQQGYDRAEARSTHQASIKLKRQLRQQHRATNKKGGDSK
ncbi:non-ribosomal peptide synthetase [Mastigocladus laminosus UU774]|nr:non-ribosomal peptide synthetase [Mastigocladus laminosus UU774]